ncbi:MAG: hypothetical protein KDG55_11200 [Rhodocyclaceae bacterium]|nr:hypothetical protein [Rhodocyclaceae bacterium]
MFLRVLLLLASVSLLVGCGTTREVRLGRVESVPSLHSAALVPREGNSNDMDEHLSAALEAHGMALKAPLRAGTRKAADVDLIVTYDDVWRWDVVMYLQSLTIRFYAGASGTLLATGRWENSALHGLQDAGAVTREVVDDMVTRLQAAR